MGLAAAGVGSGATMGPAREGNSTLGVPMTPSHTHSQRRGAVGLCLAVVGGDTDSQSRDEQSLLNL